VSSEPRATGRVAHPYLRSGAFVPLDAEGAAAYDQLIAQAVAEDLGGEDITTEAVVEADLECVGSIVARGAGVIAGLPIAARVFASIDNRIGFQPLVEDGRFVDAGTVVATVAGPARGLLTGERVALNFLGRLSGIATLTRRYVDAVGALPARIADTRKTTPGLRALERYAVRAGGGVNHRFDLASAVLIKDNHLEAAGSVGEAVRRARAHAGLGIAVEVECDDLGQVREATEAGADSVLLDNMDVETMRAAVALARGKAVVEASGGMALGRVHDVAATGVDVISVGALTHSAPALDVALDFVPAPMRDSV
jgi:nicotinate-nucleotide pyrophosphorylase (carboxylating)